MYIYIYTVRIYVYYIHIIHRPAHRPSAFRYMCEYMDIDICIYVYTYVYVQKVVYAPQEGNAHSEINSSRIAGENLASTISLNSVKTIPFIPIPKSEKIQYSRQALGLRLGGIHH
jgi:hypothetical protein